MKQDDSKKKQTNESGQETEIVQTAPSATLNKTDIESFKAEQLPEEAPIDISDSVYVKSGWIAILLVFGVFGVWAAIAPLKSASVAPGEVVVQQNNRVVEHYEGGIVSEILVEEGDRVEFNEVLIKLTPTQMESELNSTNNRLNALLTQEARLRSERMGLSAVEYPAELLEQRSNTVIQELMAGQSDLFSARKNSLEQELSIYQQKISALNEQVSGLEALVVSLEERIDSYETEIEDWEELYKQQFTEKTRLQEMKREYSRLVGEKSSNLADIARIKVQVEETRSQLVLRKQSFIEDGVSELRSIQAEKLDLIERKMALTDRLNRLEIRSPADGVIKGLTVFTVNSVVKSGETLMEVIPFTDQFHVLAKVSSSDIDRVVEGLLADIRLSAFNTQTTHVVEGRVINVSADSFEDQKTGDKYFEARVLVTENGAAQMKRDGVFLLPGMPAEVIIKTGERTLLGYILKPFENMFVRSFNED